MPDVIMPDGTVIRGVPEGTTQQELMKRYNILRNITMMQFEEHI